MRPIGGAKGLRARALLTRDLGSNLLCHITFAVRVKVDKVRTARHTMPGTWSLFIYPC